jgi:polyisoprenoid-binding protein YceI
MSISISSRRGACQRGRRVKVSFSRYMDRSIVAHCRLPVIGAALALTACQPSPGLRPSALPTPAVAAPAASAEAARYRIDAGRSEVLILVYRDGRLAGLGHNHVVAVRQLSGEIIVAADPMHSSWQLDFPVAALSVDEPQLRAAQGEDFQSTLDDVAIAGTRDHMLGPMLLDATHYPAIHLESQQLQGEGDAMHWSTRIVVREHAVDVDVPVALQRSEEELIASGEFDLTHAELGLTPYSVALGALRVAERMHVHYRLIALRERAAPP